MALMYGMGAIFYIYMTYYIMEGLMVKNKMEKITEPNANLKGAWMALAVAQFFQHCVLAAGLKTWTPGGWAWRAGISSERVVWRSSFCIKYILYYYD